MDLTQAELARRLRAAREAASLTQDAVGERLGISRSAVAQVELGNRSVTGLELGILSRLYGLDVEELLSVSRRPSPKLALFRSSLEASGAPGTFEVLLGLGEIGREISRLEKLLGFESDAMTGFRYDLPPPRSRYEAIRQGITAAEQERARAGLGDAPIADISGFLDKQGIRVALLELPRDVSGLTLIQPEAGPFVVVNATEAWVRRTFSFAHEYAHVLFDRDAEALVSRDKERNDFVEVRANSFAANLLMPTLGVRRFLASIGKGTETRLMAEAPFGDDEVSAVEARAPAKSIEMHDLVLLARHFGVSRLVAVFRLRNLGILSERGLQRLLDLERGGIGRDLDRLLVGDEVDHRPDQKRFEYRVVSLILEGLAKDLIDRRRAAKLVDFLETFAGGSGGRVDVAALLRGVSPPMLTHSGPEA